MNNPIIRVLLVDDDEDNWVLIDDLLAESETHRFLLDWRGDYVAACDEIARDVHDAYLVDYHLGGRTGLELLQDCTTQVANKPFIVLTGYEAPDTESKALAVGAIDYVSKDDLSARLLAQSIRYAINIKRTQVLLQETIQELKTTQARIVQTEKLSALGRLVAGVAHELNNPLMGVLNYVEYAQRREIQPKTGEMLSKAVRELHRMRRVVNSMLTFTHPAEQGIELVRVGEAINRALDLIAADLRHQDIKVITTVPLSLPLVCASLDGLQQVFLNLLTNARDAMSQCQEKTITITAYQQEQKVYVAVSDKGTGVPALIQARVFDPFFTTKPPGKGTGLGLSVSQNILLGFGGSLACESRKGAGTTFTLTLETEHTPENNK
ncbi:MAG: ATP-binding protein [Candidatus Competibacteraceae bacterium]|jgi:C4-dicarboxylate-specific signal transduction histidine kinase|nr:ATP-binding protein [Candidatus Competibacteraceae bacterium]